MTRLLQWERRDAGLDGFSVRAITIMMRRAILPLFALFAVSLAAAEIPVGTPVFGEAHGRQYSPSVASDGNGYLAVWLDDRAGRQGLFGTRLTEGGEVVDENGILLLRSSAGSPRVLWSGTGYVVFLGEEPRLLAVRVDREGRVIGIPATIRDSVRGSSAASNGSRIVVGYIYYPPGSDGVEMRALLMDSDLNVLSDVLLDGPGAYDSPSVAINGNEFLVAWGKIGPRATSTVHAVRLDSSGIPIGTPRYIDSAWYPAVGGDGNDWIVLSLANDAVSLKGRSLSRDLAHAGSPYVINSLPPMGRPVILWTGSAYKVFNLTFVTSSPAFTNRVDVLSVDQQGRRTDEWETLGTGTVHVEHMSLDAATNGNTALAAWDDQPSQFESRILARPASAAVRVPYTEARVISRSANGQNDVLLAHGAGTDLVVWHELNRLYANRIAADGRSLDGRGIDLGEGFDPAVAFDGKQFVVAWAERTVDQFAHVRFISPADGLLAGELRIREVRGLPALAAGGRGTLLVGTQSFDHVVWAAMIDRDLRVPTLANVVHEGNISDDYPGKPLAVWNGREFLVAWPEYQLHGSWAPYEAGYQRILGARVNANLTVLDTEPVVLGDVAGEGDRNPALATDGSAWLFAWEHGDEVRARRIGSDGVPLGDPAGVVIASGLGPAIAFDGTQYVVAWKGAAASRDVRYDYVRRTGSLDPLDGTAIAATYLDERIALVSTAPRNFSLAYSRVSEPALGSVPRAFVQRLFSPARRRSAR